MSKFQAVLPGRWKQVRALFEGVRTPDADPADEAPLHAEIFSAEQMERHGAALAGAHRLDARVVQDTLLAQLGTNQARLAKAHAALSAAVKSNRRITPAGEWLLDNFHLIEEQIRTARRHLPPGYSRKLPRLLDGPSAGLPRVYDIALEATSHGDGRIDRDSLVRFVAAYQSIAPLRLGELWAIPIMLRLALIENLSRACARILSSSADREVAAAWAERMIDATETDPKSLVLVIADMVRSNLLITSAFVAEFARRLQGQSASLAMPLTWIEQVLAESSRTIRQLVQLENQQQAAVQVSISNSIGSLRFLSSLDWGAFVETMSVVERTLRADPAGVYDRCDFATRDRYRHVVERLARQGRLDEPQVARAAIGLAAAHAAAGAADDPASHVGYYLIDDGLAQLERALGLRRASSLRLRRAVRQFPLVAYLGSIACLTMLLTAGLLETVVDGIGWSGWAIVFGVAGIFATSESAMSLVNWTVTLLASPKTLPRMDFSKGIPAESRTLVAVPTLIGSVDGIEKLVEALEVRFLANRHEHLHFALLTDLPDAHAPDLPGDAPLLALARQRIDELNERYAPDTRDRFFLFHRPRRWNPSERTWMGYERKRGKLGDLNALLRDGVRSRFSLIVGEIDVLMSARYVITLDSDTQLPRDAAHEIIGTLAHPLNRAIYDEARGRVTRGYGILQPRIGAGLSGTRRSWYVHLFGAEPGIDPYTRSVSDVYQDLFAEGSFIGKGIYDIDAFERSLRGRFPENRILSHDLLEGCHARSGLLSNALLYEDHPARYAADASRRHRWIRGDWQLMRWLLPRVRDEAGRSVRNPLPSLSRWKILDNLRRSLVPVALVVLLLAGWALLPFTWTWTMSVLTLVALPFIAALAVDLVRKSVEVPLARHLRVVTESAGRQLARIGLGVACLPYEAFMNLDAIVRTMWRMGVSGRHLLQWKPSSEVERTQRTDVAASYAAMWVGPATALVTGVALFVWRPTVVDVAAPILLLWLLSPAITWWISRPRARRAPALATAQTAFLRRTARRTWGFFETHVGAEDHWLPPDNVQEQPTAVVAHRTSPTNIGLSLLANLGAYDFGYIGAGTLIERTAHTLSTLRALPRHRGHLFNWYDTLTLEPLPPRYVSTVDSGNLAGHLLTLRQGLLMLPGDPVLDARVFEGLQDTLELAATSLGAARSPAVTALQDALAAARAAPADDLATLDACLGRIDEHAHALVESLAQAPHEARHWASLLAARCEQARRDARAFMPADGPIPSLRALAERGTGSAAERARARIGECERLAREAEDLAEMDFDFLYDRARHLLAIGYNVDERRLDASYYDLLASEARLGNFVAIAQGQLPQQSWFALGRLLVVTEGEPVLLSWSGSMFEYLMPQLVMPNYEGTLLGHSMRAVVEAQIAYGRERGVAWGISESGYNAFDARLNYQYRAFGVPGLGLKRGLAQDLVVAPYATMLALMVAPEAACANLQRLAAEGCEGRFGFYEAIDHTPARLPRGQSRAIVRSYMAHHQGMGFLSLAYLLLGQPMQRRFMADPRFQAVSLLLQERVPKVAAYLPHQEEAESVTRVSPVAETRLRVLNSPATDRPAVQLLSNGRYHVMVTAAGGGYSRHRDLAVTRWREDGTGDGWGSFCYLRDIESEAIWSTAHLPTRTPVDGYEAILSDAKAEFRGRKHGIDTHTEIAVSPEDDIELRRLRLVNRSRKPRTIEITSYAEVVLAPDVADALHPAFSKLFVQTELVPERQAIVCTRRPRSADEPMPWMFHLVAVHEADVDEISYETDRARFLGRGRELAHPQAMDVARLSNSQGSVLDPIVAIRCRVTLDPDQSATIDFVSGIGASRAECSALIDKYRDRRLADRVFDLAWTHGQVMLRQIDASQTDAQLFERLAGWIIYANRTLRADAALLAQNRRGQSGLWGQMISGDHPIVLVQIADPGNIELVRQMVQAHAYWRLKGLTVDLVIWNEDHAGYRQLLQDQITGLIAAGAEANLIDRPGGIFVRPAQQLSNEDRVLVQSVARAIISDTRGTLLEQVARRRAPDEWPPAFVAKPPRRELVPAAAAFDPNGPFTPAAAGALRFDNGLGGFASDGREYVVTLGAHATTPAPWSNVLANPQFGTVVSESGLGYTWSENAHEFRLTPWANDPVGDACGEAFYLRDEDSGRTWSPTPLPWRGEGGYRIRHGFGYSVYEHVEDGIQSELWVYVALDAAVKFSVLRLRNVSGRARRLSATGYVEWVLGDLHAKSHMHVMTELDADGAIFARNFYNAEFGGRAGFFDVDGAARSVTGDRVEFIGRNGSLRRPAALGRQRLSGKVGPALDPCAAIQVPIELADGQPREVAFRLGAGRDAADAASLAHGTRGIRAAREALAAVHRHWRRTLGAVQVRTPDPAVDALANGWLLYQTIACRFWARSGYYQSGGAFGFRDQLQDAMALVHTEPATLRRHLLLCAAHQFPEGDVQHWWHPPLDRGVRTRCSDDYLWLPLAACRYVQATGDIGVLDETAGYVEGRVVDMNEESYYDLPIRSSLSEPLYGHCVRALRHGLRTGERGLPLIGTGDWNDGMNRVGEHGRGESVWLGFFLHDVLLRFAPLARRRGDDAFAAQCVDAAARLRENIETHAWDGAWYRRAWFDDGTPLGSARNAECQIDSISQSWSVLSGAADPQRRRQAMAALDERLVRRDAALVQLLDPPFDRSEPDPGYIRGYVPGVRENGGQYTHAAVWAAMAFAELGDAERAWELLGLINPVNHGRTAAQVATYKVEPYVVAADVYGVAPHVGRGGWTWYTGSAGWMYRLIVESLLGLRLEGDRLRVAPVMPAHWEDYEIDYRRGDSLYRIRVVRIDGAHPAEHRDAPALEGEDRGADARARGVCVRVSVDGVQRPDDSIALVDDGREHAVEVRLASQAD